MRTKLFTTLGAAAVLAGLGAAAPAAAVPVVGDFTATIIEISGDETAAAPEFSDQAPVAGRFGYDTALATDSNPDPPS